MSNNTGTNGLLRSIGKSIEKEYKTDGGKANMQLVIMLLIILIIALTTDLAETITNLFLALLERDLIVFLPPWVLPVCIVSLIGTGIWCVSRISKIELSEIDD